MWTPAGHHFSSETGNKVPHLNFLAISFVPLSRPATLGYFIVSLDSVPEIMLCYAFHLTFFAYPNKYPLLILISVPQHGVCYW